MKLVGPASPLRTLIACIALLIAHAILLQVMARTRVIEDVMAMQFERWELGLILAFLITRLMVYFLVPSVIVALLVRLGLQKLSKDPAA